MLAIAAGPARPAMGADGYRPLPAGVLVEIPPDDSLEEITSRVNVPRVLAAGGTKEWKPEMAAKERTLLGQFTEKGRDQLEGSEVFRDLWCLAFAFAPPRMIDVDLPAADLQMRRARLWYMIYRVKNVGGWKLDVDPADPAVRPPRRFELPVRFVPSFVMETRQAMTPSEGIVSYRSYADRLVPGAIAAIKRRERIEGRLFDSAAMAAGDIEPGEERLGVAVWQNVHPDVGFFSVIVTGLTNRFCHRPPEQGARGDGGRVTLESLELDFWHRGDAKNPAEASISIGYEGLFEQVALGGRLVEAVGRAAVSKARPSAGFASIGLKNGWRGLLDPPLTERAALDRRVPISLEPLARVIDSIGRIESTASRTAAIRDIFGDGGPEAFEAVLRAVAGSAGGEPLRRIGVDPAVIEKGGFESLAAVVRRLDAVRPTADRDAAEAAVFGVESRRFTSLKQGLLAARTVAVLEENGIDQAVLGSLGARQAFDRVWREIGKGVPPAGREAGEKGEDRDGRVDGDEGSGCFARDRDASVLPAAARQAAEGLFGAEGPMLAAAATAQHPGIDHRWFFRYEIEED